MHVQSMVIVLLASSLTDALSWDELVKVATCRVNCVKTLLQWPPTDEACHSQENCSQCWVLCEFLLLDQEWRHLCRPTADDLCIPGCREACDFPIDHISTTVSDKWSFSRQLNVTRGGGESGYLRAEWQPPRRQSDDDDGELLREDEYTPLIYSITEETEDPAHWTLLYMGVNTSVDVTAVSGSNDGREQNGRFRLMAFVEDGLATEQTVPQLSLKREDYEKTYDYALGDQPESHDEFPTNHVPTENSVQMSRLWEHLYNHANEPVDIDSYDGDYRDDAPSYNMSVVVERGHHGTLRARVTWTIYRNDVMAATGDGDVAKCTINWARNTCNVDHSYPFCDVPNDHEYHIRGARSGEEVEYVITKLTYNSRYWVSVEVGRIESKWVEFDTPGCSTPTTLFTRCPETKPEYVIDTGASWSPNITCLDPELISMGSLRMRIQWPVPPLANGRAPIEYRVTYMGLTPDDDNDNDNNVFSVDTKKTANTSVTLQLNVNAIYDITVTAEMNANSDSLDFVSSTLIVKTTQLVKSAGKDTPYCDLSTQQTAAASHGHDAGKAVPLLLILTCSLLGVAMIACISLLICRKWRRLQANIITHKMMVAKNNIYNSVPERPDEISGVEQQRLLAGDEWELDPREIQLGSELGHGAFGKVYTGFYRDSKVAIKVMKEEMPVYCKDDLLCEIALMKKVGPHPNIVSLVGACTLGRPIALIMEFMPFGNLERFLQKCKLEGELKKQDDDSYSVAYALVNDFGDTEQWVVTSSDMLSFARQVALAMEYLSACECVHRDLAARNVLIGHGKVVKVCDFGLARVMSSDGGYLKRSSGKLPLKWLALETLRGYVHTTYSDVWSYGVLLWEIVTMGSSPYSDIALANLFTVLSNGYRMGQPSNCSNELYEIMSQCWYENPKDRPTFTQLRTRIEGLLARQENYLELCDFVTAPVEA